MALEALARQPTMCLKSVEKELTFSARGHLLKVKVHVYSMMEEYKDRVASVFGGLEPSMVAKTTTGDTQQPQ